MAPTSALSSVDDGATTAAPSTPTSLPAESPLAARLATTRAHLMRNGLYLGDPKVVERVEWVRDGKSHKLVVRQCAGML